MAPITCPKRLQMKSKSQKLDELKHIYGKLSERKKEAGLNK